ncbi:histamine H1 receptor-like isoform X2 [Parasteatoda tepidariorum]|nr:histamine H1 receptor-like [Parasteatoda tepidariorum]XP_042903761.1 histamine H1 receptor-like [Parasteatoda tepidariorum]XP_042903762.1 histamine H1 receptor-like [Parasteatoda tepidariorum]
MFIMSLAVADLTVGLVVMPISSAYVLMGKWRFGLAVCQFWLSADYSASTASILNLLVLSLDRYWSISRPLEYLRRRSKKRALVVITIVWIGSFLWLVPIIGWHQFFADGVRKQPTDVCETEFADNVVFKLTTSTMNFYCPMVAMIVTYARIYMQIRKRARSEVMNRCSDIRPDSVSSSEPQPIRYAIAAQTPVNRGKKDRKKKKKDAKLSPDIPLPREHCQEQIPTPCNASCDGYGAATVNTDTRWRCNMCGATQKAVEEWPWACPQPDETRMMQKTPSEEDSSSGSQENGTKVKKIRVSRKCKNSGIQLTTPTNGAKDIHLQVPQLQNNAPPSRSSSFRILCGATRGVLRRPSSRRSVASLRQETKAARQLGVIIGAFVLCWLPYMILFVVTAACEKCLGPGVHTAAIWLGYFNSTVNPVIYALCNASFKRAFWKIGSRFSTGWKRKSRRRNNDFASENNPFA